MSDSVRSKSYPITVRNFSSLRFINGRGISSSFAKVALAIGVSLQNLMAVIVLCRRIEKGETEKRRKENKAGV